MAKTTLVVRPIGGTPGSHLADTTVGVAVNRAWALCPREVVVVVREPAAGVLVVLVVVGVLAVVLRVLTDVLRVLAVVLVLVRVGTRTGEGTGGGHGVVNSGDGSTNGWGCHNGTSSGIGIGDGATGGSIGTTGVEVIVSAGGESRNGSGEESEESERSLGRHVDDDLN